MPISIDISSAAAKIAQEREVYHKHKFKSFSGGGKCAWGLRAAAATAAEGAQGWRDQAAVWSNSQEIRSLSKSLEEAIGRVTTGNGDFK